MNSFTGSSDVMKLWKRIDRTVVKCAIRHITQYPSDAKGKHCRFVVEFVSVGERHFCHRSYLCCDKTFLVSIATSSPVPRHAVRQKAWLTCCTSSWTDKSVPIQWNKCCVIRTTLFVCQGHFVKKCLKEIMKFLDFYIFCGSVFVIWCIFLK